MLPLPKLFGFVLFSCLSLSAFAEDSVKSAGIAMQSMEFCSVDYTELGRRARFHGSAIYQSVVGEDGRIAKLTPVSIPEFMSALLQLGQFESCVKRWDFQDPGEYTITFSAGTSAERNKITLITKDKSLTLFLQEASVL